MTEEPINLLNTRCRAWDKENKRMHYFTLWEISDGKVFDPPIPADGEHQAIVDLRDCEGMLATGVFDRDDVEVYQGDHVRGQISSGILKSKPTVEGPVRYAHGTFYIKGKNYHPALSEMGWIEILGNPYETPGWHKEVEE